MSEGSLLGPRGRPKYGIERSLFGKGAVEVREEHDHLWLPPLLLDPFETRPEVGSPASNRSKADLLSAFKGVDLSVVVVRLLTAIQDDSVLRDQVLERVHLSRTTELG